MCLWMKSFIARFVPAPSIRSPTTVSSATRSQRGLYSINARMYSAWSPTSAYMCRSRRTVREPPSATSASILARIARIGAERKTWRIERRARSRLRVWTSSLKALARPGVVGTESELLAASSLGDPPSMTWLNHAVRLASCDATHAFCTLAAAAAVFDLIDARRVFFFFFAATTDAFCFDARGLRDRPRPRFVRCFRASVEEDDAPSPFFFPLPPFAAVEPTAVMVILLLGPRFAATASVKVALSESSAEAGVQSTSTSREAVGGTVMSNVSMCSPDACDGARASVTRFDSVA